MCLLDFGKEKIDTDCILQLKTAIMTFTIFIVLKVYRSLILYQICWNLPALSILTTDGGFYILLEELKKCTG